jgi:RimJ/RimL family protein N-acetyltransferase
MCYVEPPTPSMKQWAMDHPYWPLFDLRILTQRVEIRLPDDDVLAELAQLALKGVHDPALMPFLHPWTDAPQNEIGQGMMRWGWRHRATWSPNDWSFGGAVFVNGQVVGVQSLMAVDFAALRSIKSGSWLGLAHHGKGIGKEMRSAMLQFAFETLGAEEALSGGFYDNESSLGVSRALGYEESGRRTISRRGIPTEMIDLRIDRFKWRNGTHPEVEIQGFEECRNFFISASIEERSEPPSVTGFE